MGKGLRLETEIPSYTDELIARFDAGYLFIRLRLGASAQSEEAEWAWEKIAHFIGWEHHTFMALEAALCGDTLVASHAGRDAFNRDSLLSRTGTSFQALLAEWDEAHAAITKQLRDGSSGVATHPEAVGVLLECVAHYREHSSV